MNVFVIITITLIGLVALAWFWRKTPGLKRTTARTWPASRGKMGAKPWLAPPL